MQARRQNLHFDSAFERYTLCIGIVGGWSLALIGNASGTILRVNGKSRSEAFSRSLAR